MAPTPMQTTVFRRGSNVLEYWLAHAEGFEVGSGIVARKRVEGVVVDAVQGRARGVIVRSPFRRRHVLPAEAFAAVDPFARQLELERKPSRFAAVGRRAVGGLTAFADTAAAALGPRLRRADELAAVHAHRLRIRLAEAEARLRPRLNSYARAAGIAALAFAAAVAEGVRVAYARLAEEARESARRRRPRSWPPTTR